MFRHYTNEISRYIVHIIFDGFCVWGAVFSVTMGHRLCESRSADSIVEKEFLLDSEADPADWLLAGVILHGAYSFCASRQGGLFLPKHKIKYEIKYVQLMHAPSIASLILFFHTCLTQSVYAFMA